MTALRSAFPIGNGFAPAKGPKALPIVLDFTAVALHEFDLVKEELADITDFVQTVYVDNHDNPNELTLRFSVTNQRLVIPAGATGIWPVLAPQNLRVTAETEIDEDAIISLTFLNVPMPLTQWGPITVNVDTVTATFTPTPCEFADHSGDITAGGTSQTLFAANGDAVRRVVQNPPANAEPIYINFGGAAAQIGVDSVGLLPGETFDTGTGPIDQSEWTINAATTGVTFIAKEAE
jgi:hypothetical protein